MLLVKNSSLFLTHRTPCVRSKMVCVMNKDLNLGWNGFPFRYYDTEDVYATEHSGGVLQWCTQSILQSWECVEVTESIA